jgi:hypothetical protein
MNWLTSATNKLRTQILPRSATLLSENCGLILTTSIFTCVISLWVIESLLGLIFNPEDGGNMFLWNVCCLSMHYRALYASRQKASYFCSFSITIKITNDITQTPQGNILFSCLTCLKFNKQNSIGFEVLTTVTMKNTTIFWDMMPNSAVEVYRHFRGTYCFHLHGCRIRQASAKQSHSAEKLKYLYGQWGRTSNWCLNTWVLRLS